jgi:hypothetical protein
VNGEQRKKEGYNIKGVRLGRERRKGASYKKNNGLRSGRKDKLRD